MRINIDPISHLFRIYNPINLLRKVLRSPAYTRGEYMVSSQEIPPRQAVYHDDIYENSRPQFGEEDQLYSQQRDMDMHLPQSNPHAEQSLQFWQRDSISSHGDGVPCHDDGVPCHDDEIPCHEDRPSRH